MFIIGINQLHILKHYNFQVKIISIKKKQSSQLTLTLYSWSFQSHRWQWKTNWCKRPLMRKPGSNSHAQSIWLFLSSPWAAMQRVHINAACTLVTFKRGRTCLLKLTRFEKRDELDCLQQTDACNDWKILSTEAVKKQRVSTSSRDSRCPSFCSSSHRSRLRCFLRRPFRRFFSLLFSPLVFEAWVPGKASV